MEQDEQRATRGRAWLPIDPRARNSARDPVEWLRYYEGLLDFTNWLIQQARTLPGPTRTELEMDLTTLQREAGYLEEHIRFWKKRKRERKRRLRETG